MFDWVVEAVQTGGYPAVAALMFLENIFPPIPSELIMAVAGFAAARGDLSFAGVLAAGTAGSVLGALPWYVAARVYGLRRLEALAARHGRWLTMGPDDVERARAAFARQGWTAVLFGRLVPTVRTLISVPAGLAAMRPAPFLVLSALGTLAWTALLAGAGHLLEDQYRRVADYLNPVSAAIVILLAILYVWRVATWTPR